MKQLFDATGKAVKLGSQIAKGGEGTVFHLANDPSVVAKVYHKAPGPERIQKLCAMASDQSGELTNLACWPTDLLHELRGGPVVGFLMPNADGFKEIHKLYGPKSRQSEFQRVDWRFLIAAATNVCRAFAVVHKHGQVIGDVNHSSVMVAADATVRLIDCDSFQIKSGDQLFTCDVLEPLHTAPELQGQSPKGLLRSANHDCFGLAVLIFELLFMGRHPFIGEYLGPGEKPSEQKIADHLFAYGEGAAGRKMKQPPHTLTLDAIPPEMATLFETAFLEQGVTARPSASDWIAALDKLQQELKRCSKRAAHYYYSECENCPWCGIEEQLGISLFSIAVGDIPSQRSFNLALVWERIAKVPKPRTGAIPSEQRLPKVTPAPRYVTLGKFLIGFKRFALLAGVVVGTSIAGHGSFFGLAVPAGLMSWIILWSFAEFLAGQWRKKPRTLYMENLAMFQRLRAQWVSTASEGLFDRVFADLESKKKILDDLPGLRQKELDEMHRKLQERQLYHFLDRFRIEPGIVPGVGAGRIAVLNSYGVETAADITPQSVKVVPGFGEKLLIELMNWRLSTASLFRFDASKGLDPQDVNNLDANLAQMSASSQKDLMVGETQLRQIANQMHESASRLREPLDECLRAVAQTSADLKALAGQVKKP